MIGEWDGTPCIIASHKKQKKASKYKLINWLYKKVYGDEEVPALPDGTDMMYFDGQLIFRSYAVFERIMEDLGVKEVKL
jgi:hypothetical protein